MSLSRLFRQAEPEPEWPEFDKSQYERWAEEAKAIVDADPPLEIEPLPPYDHDAKCPKCHYLPGTTEFTSGWHETCSIKGSPWNPMPLWATRTTAQSVLDATRFYRRQQAIPEHFERACPNCKHHWAEAVT